MTVDEIINFYKNSDTQELSKAANRVCYENYGNEIFIRGLIEFSNYCEMDCLYCGIRKSNTRAIRYRLTQEQILKIVETGVKHRIKTFVLQSGEDRYYTINDICSIVENIKKIDHDAAVTLSCGIFTKEQYRSLRNAGADRYLIRFETSDPGLHSYLRNGISFKRRMQALSDLKECGYEVGSGYMVGLPGETEQIRINNALLCAEYGIDMIGIGPFIPHEHTPLKNSKLNNIDLAVRACALVRLLLPLSNMPATTAAGSLTPLGREKMLQAGANVLMPNLTPADFKKHYLLYPGKICLDESGFECIGCLSNRVGTIGKTISFERGNSKSWNLTRV